MLFQFFQSIPPNQVHGLTQKPSHPRAIEHVHSYSHLAFSRTLLFPILNLPNCVLKTANSFTLVLVETVFVLIYFTGLHATYCLSLSTRIFPQGLKWTNVKDFWKDWWTQVIEQTTAKTWSVGDFTRNTGDFNSLRTYIYNCFTSVTYLALCLENGNKREWKHRWTNEQSILTGTMPGLWVMNKMEYPVYSLTYHSSMALANDTASARKWNVEKPLKAWDLIWISGAFSNSLSLSVCIGSNDACKIREIPALIKWSIRAQISEEAPLFVHVMWQAALG